MDEPVRQLSQKLGIDQGLAEKISGVWQKNPTNLGNLPSDDGQGMI
jgi:hypothetical protein